MGCPRFHGAGGRLLGEGCIPAPQLQGEILNEKGGENPATCLGQATSPSTSRALTVWVLVVHHIQVIFIRFHVSQQIVSRDIAAFCLFIVCMPKEREISSSTSPVSCPSMPGCAQTRHLSSPLQSCSWHLQSPPWGAQEKIVLLQLPRAQCASPVGWNKSNHPNLQDKFTALSHIKAIYR